MGDEEIKVDKVVDARGAFCPGPLMELIRVIKSEPVGSVIAVYSTDKGSMKDIPAWIAKVGHAHLRTEEKEGYWSVVVKKLK